MDLKIFQKGFNYSQDGQGNRLVYHLQGCNMHCPWCANPEGMQRSGSCEGIPLEEVYQEIMSSRPMFYDGGGVTFSGGEATLQFEPIKELLAMLKKTDVHTAIETNGSHPKLEELLPYIDQLIVDCKHWEPKKHKEYTGIPLEAVVENIKKAIRINRQIDIRTPVIGGVNASEEDFVGFLRLYKELNAPNVTFELLRYHEYGRKKWEQCGRVYQMTKEANVTIEQMKTFQKMIVDNGLMYKNS